MPQLARLDAAGVPHHIIIDGIERIRGIERRALFEDVFDRESFLKNYGRSSRICKPQIRGCPPLLP